MEALSLHIPDGSTAVMLEVVTGALPNGPELILEAEDGTVLGASFSREGLASPNPMN